MVEIYTDGACIGNGLPRNIGGWSFVVVIDGKKHHKSVGVVQNTTNNVQEIQSVLNAIKYATFSDIKPFSIYSDSQYVVNGFNKWMDNWKKKDFKRYYKEEDIIKDIPNAILWKEICWRKKTYPHFSVQWIRGHSGNVWNEMADQLIEQEMIKHPEYEYIKSQSYPYNSRR